MLNPLTLLFQKSLSTKYILQDWKDAYIMPVHKGGNRSGANNYQPISLTSAIGKLLKSIVNSAIMILLNTNNLLSPNQHGFRPN
jgi:hypothetical protein